MARVWTDSDVEEVLRLMLPATDALAYGRALVEVARQYAVGARAVRVGAGSAVTYSEHPVGRLLWGLATCVRVYRVPAGGQLVQRGGEAPPSYTELQLLRWAGGTRTQLAQQQPTVPYLALLLHRPEVWTGEQWRVHGPARGRQGFFG